RLLLLLLCSLPGPGCEGGFASALFLPAALFFSCGRKEEGRTSPCSQGHRGGRTARNGERNTLALDLQVAEQNRSYFVSQIPLPRDAHLRDRSSGFDAVALWTDRQENTCQ